MLTHTMLQPISKMIKIVKHLFTRLRSRFKNKLYLHSFESNEWSRVYPIQKVQLSNLIIPKSVVEELLYDTHVFMKSKAMQDLIRSFNIPLKRTVLIEGLQGSCKKDILFMIATQYKKDIYDFSSISTIKELLKSLKNIDQIDGILLFRTDNTNNRIFLIQLLCKMMSDIDWKHPTLLFILNEENSYKTQHNSEYTIDYKLYVPCVEKEQLSLIYRSMLGGKNTEEELEFIDYMYKLHMNVSHIRQWLIRLAPRIVDDSESIMDCLSEIAEN